MSKRTRLTPNQWTGWKPALVVEIELVGRTPAVKHSVYAVYLNGERIGWVYGYAKYGRTPARWGYQVSGDQPGFHNLGFHAGDSRRAMVEAVIEQVQRA